MTPEEALTVLGLAPGASPEARKTAFRNCVKAARPDHPGGDAERFRRVIEAYRRLEQADARPAAAAGAGSAAAVSATEVEISIEEACLGGARIVSVVPERAFYWSIEPGLRDGDLVRETTPFGEIELRVRIVAAPDRKVMGDDLWITLAVDPWLLEDGGRIEASTPLGPRSVWVPRGLPENAMLRLKDCGLPAREGYPQGHAFLKLVPDPALAGSGLRAMFSRLSSAVAPNARAARRAGVLS